MTILILLLYPDYQGAPGYGGHGHMGHGGVPGGYPMGGVAPPPQPGYGQPGAYPAAGPNPAYPGAPSSGYPGAAPGYPQGNYVQLKSSHKQKHILVYYFYQIIANIVNLLYFIR